MYYTLCHHLTYLTNFLPHINDMHQIATKILKQIFTNIFHFSKACVLSGALAALSRDYQDRVDFLCVYLAEAHSEETWSWERKFHYMTEHNTIDDRIEVAR